MRFGHLRLYHVSGDSMEPTYTDGDIVVGELTRQATDIRLEDIVIVRSPHDEAHLIVKRVAGLPGMELELVGCGSGPIAPGMCAILSDNPSRGGDSRSRGPIPMSDIVARVLRPRRQLGARATQPQDLR